MDLLTGYGSDEEQVPRDIEESSGHTSNGRIITGISHFLACFPGLAVMKTNLAGHTNAGANGSYQLAEGEVKDDLNGSASLTAAFENKLPAPRKKVKKFVQIRAPLIVAPDSSDEVRLLPRYLRIGGIAQN